MEQLTWNTKTIFGKIIRAKVKTEIEDVLDFSNLIMAFENNENRELFAIELNNIKKNDTTYVSINTELFEGDFIIFRKNNNIDITYNLSGLPINSSGNIVFYLNDPENPKEPDKPKETPPKKKELGDVFTESSISVLTDDFEEQVMKSNKHVLLLLYAPWCGWCKRIAPDFIKTNENLKTNSEVKVMVVDATKHKIDHPNVNIVGFPMVILFKKNDKANPVEYNGNRSSDDMVNFVNTQISEIQKEPDKPKETPPKKKELGDVFTESSISVLTDDFEEQVMKSNKHVLLLLYAPWCGWCKRIAPDFIKTNENLKTNSEVKVMVVDATKHKIDHPNVNIVGFPMVILFKKNDKANPVEYNGNRSSDDMVNFVNTQISEIQKEPDKPKETPPKKKELGDVFTESSISVLTDDFEEQVMKSNKHVLLLLYAPWCGWCKRIAPDFIKTNENLKTNSEVKVMVVDATKHKIDHPNVNIVGFPMVILFKKNDKANPLEYNGNRSSDDMVNFVNKEIAKKVPEVRLFKPLDKAELKKACNLYINNKKTAVKQFGKIETWDTSYITDMSNLFSEYKDFNENISKWNTSNVTDMKGMFYNATNFNRNLNNWDVSKVKNMSNLFGFAEAFNHSIDKWNVKNVTTMEAMFNNAKKFAQNISNWNVSQVTAMNHMFYNALKFNSPINKWDVSQVTTMKAMFYNAVNFNKPLIDWDVSQVTDMEGMFTSAKKFNQSINTWKVYNVTNMNTMFYLATNFNYSIDKWDVSRVKTMDYMFMHAEKFNQNVANWNINNVTSMIQIFEGTNNLNNNNKFRMV